MQALKVDSSQLPAANIVERIKTVVIGAGQAGLSIGYHLAKHSIPFTILNADRQIGDSWRNRWDSLRLFTPARYDGFDGMPFPAGPRTYPTKDEMTDYLMAYARRLLAGGESRLFLRQVVLQRRPAAANEKNS
jgi:putative flavoprotein involved in K+ transport